MGVLDFLKDARFNYFFSFILGVGIVCVLRPICTGPECNVTKAPTDKDFEKFVYRMGAGKCFEFKSEIVQCPSSGAIEAFRECSKEEFNGDKFARRISTIRRCE